MKIRLLGQGYDKFDGYFGEVLFKDGVSVGNVSDAQARFFASIMSIENVDTGEDPGANAQFQAALKMEAVSFTLPTLAELQAAEQPAAPAAEVVTAPASGVYTQASLEEIADKQGIAGLRDIAEPLGLKGNSIAKLIEGILKAQAPEAPAAQTFPEGQPDVVTSEQAE